MKDKRRKKTPRRVSARGVLLHRISPVMWPDGQENDRFIIQTLAKTELTIPDAAAFFANHVDDAKVAVYPGAATAAQV